MTLLQAGEQVRIHEIGLGLSPAGDTLRQGDGHTVEGAYRINRLSFGSAYHLSLGLDSPPPVHIAAAKTRGFDPGGDIMIHGQPNTLPDAAIIKGNRAAACIAVSDTQIREIFAATPLGTAAKVRPWAARPQGHFRRANSPAGPCPSHGSSV